MFRHSTRPSDRPDSLSTITLRPEGTWPHTSESSEASLRSTSLRTARALGYEKRAGSFEGTYDFEMLGAKDRWSARSDAWSVCAPRTLTSAHRLARTPGACMYMKKDTSARASNKQY